MNWGPYRVVATGDDEWQDVHDAVEWGVESAVAVVRPPREGKAIGEEEQALIRPTVGLIHLDLTSHIEVAVHAGADAEVYAIAVMNLTSLPSSVHAAMKTSRRTGWYVDTDRSVEDLVGSMDADIQLGL